jgi:hypothetical protein
VSLTLDVLGSSAQPTGLAPNGTHRCVFCREEIQPSASLCPHCRSNLVPLQRLADEGAALEERVAMLEQAVATLRLANSAAPERESSAVVASVEADPPMILGIKWPHLADNIFRGLGRADRRPLARCLAARRQADRVRPVSRAIHFVHPGRQSVGGRSKPGHDGH